LWFFVAVYLRVKIFWVSLLPTSQNFKGCVQEFILDFAAYCPLLSNFETRLHTLTLLCLRMESSYWTQFVHGFVDVNKKMWNAWTWWWGSILSGERDLMFISIMFRWWHWPHQHKAAAWSGAEGELYFDCCYSRPRWLSTAGKQSTASASTW
jgi:hypothetical protein